MDAKRSLLLLFDRPNEPTFMLKGDNFDKQLMVPPESMPDRYKGMSSMLADSFGNPDVEQIPVKVINLPDLSEITKLRRLEQFSLWIPKHRRLAGQLIDIFLAADSIDDLLAYAVYARDRVNPYLFVYAYSAALIHRPDTKDLEIPLVAEEFPGKFLDSAVFRDLREEMTAVGAGDRLSIMIPWDYTASHLNDEHKLWYYREDIGLNLHHWHWHLVHPTEATDVALVAKDRRGELFYYMHKQIVSRYNIERFCNGMNRAVTFNDFRATIEEGYFPKMDSLVAGRAWAARPDNSTIKDVTREVDEIQVNIDDLELWRDRIMEAIRERAVINTENEKIPLEADGSTDRGIHLLGCTIESNVLSPNRTFYGDFHNLGHVMFAFIHDPDHKHMEFLGVIGDNTTAMRDPIFYRWHTYVDEVFQEYKEQLEPYSLKQLTFPGVTVDSVQVIPEKSKEVNTFHTFWQQSDMNVSRGLDFLPRENIFVSFTHLQHEPYTLSFQITNSTAKPLVGLVRVFLAPKKNETGAEMLFREQRHFMIEMDKFMAQLQPGQNVVRNASSKSNVVIPYEQTFRTLNLPNPEIDTPEAETFSYCGCGWPEHMLVPRGTPEGYECELFVMVSDYEQDKVDQDMVGTCTEATSYCGVRDRLYPDRRPMGYPFDRLPRAGSDSLATFLTPNMGVQKVTIYFSDEVKQKKSK